MQACLMCDRPDVALEAFDYGINDLGIVGGGEWQWGGGRDRVDPLCRDMAIRAMKGKRGTSELAAKFFQEVLDENVTISIEAVQGVVGAFELDEDWEASLGFLLYILENHKRPKWLVDGTKLEIRELFPLPTSESTDESNWVTKMGPLLASVMRTCNARSQFGTSILSLLLTTENGEKLNEMSITTKLTTCLSGMEFCDELLIATINSLCGLRLYKIAVDVYEKVERDTNQKVTSDCAWSAYHYALEEHLRHGTIEVGNPAINAIAEIERLVQASKAYENHGGGDIVKKRKAVQSILAEAMKACTYIRQSDLSFVLFNWISSKTKGAKQKFSFPYKIATPVDLDDDFAMQSDALLAEVVSARRWNTSTAETNNVFEVLLPKIATDLKDWTKSCNAGLAALLVKGDGDAGLKMFRALDKKAINSDLFVTVADHLVKEQQWVAVKDVYDSALKDGYVSEELSTIAMKAIASSEMDNRIILLREITEQVAELNGTNPQAWLRENYWSLKRSIGFKYARLLMWWNDPITCQLDELNFAIEEMNERTANGADVSYDAIRTIVNSAKKGLANDNLDKYRWIPSTVEEWKELLELVVYQAQLTNHLDSKMIDEIVRSYIALECREDCIHFVLKSLHDGVRVNKFSLYQALEAANLESSEAVNDLQMMLSR